MICATAAPCEVVIGGSVYATISSAPFGMEATLVRVADQRFSAAVVRGPTGMVCCGPYAIDLASRSPGGSAPTTMTVDSDPCLPMCPPCLICAFNVGQRRACELGDDPQSRLDMLLLYTFLAVGALAVVRRS